MFQTMPSLSTRRALIDGVMPWRPEDKQEIYRQMRRMIEANARGIYAEIKLDAWRKSPASGPADQRDRSSAVPHS